VEARRCFERAVSLHPTSVVARRALALTFSLAGEWRQALEIWASLSAEHPDDVEARLAMGLALLKVKRFEHARETLESVVRDAPTHRRAWGYLGVALERLGQSEAAERAFLAGRHVSAVERIQRFKSPSREHRSTMPPGEWSSDARPAVPRLSAGARSVFTTTLRPPSVIPRALGTGFSEPTARPPSSEEQTLTPPRVPADMGPQPFLPVVPLLDAALASLLVVPHEPRVVGHATGMVLVGLDYGAPSGAGRFAARVDMVHAHAGSLEGFAIDRGEGPSTEPFLTSNPPFLRFAGRGQLLLAPPSGAHLAPLAMNNDLAFFREDVIAGFEERLDADLGLIHFRSGATAMHIVRFRGDGVVVLSLKESFLAIDVRGEDVVTLRADALLGWLGNLVPEPYEGATNLLTFTGEGTLLFRAPHGTNLNSERSSP